jgi:hypothetical protein
VRILAILALLASVAYGKGQSPVPFVLRGVGSNQDLGGLNNNLSDITGANRDKLVPIVSDVDCSQSGGALVGATEKGGFIFGGSCQVITNTSAGGGGSALGVANGTSGVPGAMISSPTAAINFDNGPFIVVSQGGATAYLTLNPSSVALLSGGAVPAYLLNFSTITNQFNLVAVTTTSIAFNLQTTSNTFVAYIGTTTLATASSSATYLAFMGTNTVAIQNLLVYDSTASAWMVASAASSTTFNVYIGTESVQLRSVAVSTTILAANQICLPGGGSGTTICGPSVAANSTSNIQGGVFAGNTNTVSGQWAVVLGGNTNSASGTDSVAMGGGNNTSAGVSSFALGNKATANGIGSFVYSDVTGTAGYQDHGPNTANFRTNGGFFIDSSSGVWVDSSSVNITYGVVAGTGAFTGNVTGSSLTAITGMALNYVTGTQCLHSINGAVTGTGSDCGSGGGGGSTLIFATATLSTDGTGFAAVSKLNLDTNYFSYSTNTIGAAFLTLKSAAISPVSDNFLAQANGSNKVFTLSQTPASLAAISVILDGTLLSGTSDYTWTPPSTITLTTAPATACTGPSPSNCTSSLFVNYFINTSNLPAAAILAATQTFSGGNSLLGSTTFYGQVFNQGTYTFGTPSTSVGADAGQPTFWAFSVDGVTQSSGCVMGLSTSGSGSFAYRIASSTTTAYANPAVVLASISCAPNTWCQFFSKGAVVRATSQAGQAAQQYWGTSTTRCSLRTDASTNPTDGGVTFRTPDSSNVWQWVQVGL